MTQVDPAHARLDGHRTRSPPVRATETARTQRPRRMPLPGAACLGRGPGLRAALSWHSTSTSRVRPPAPGAVLLLAAPTLLLYPHGRPSPADSTVAKGMYAFGPSLLGLILVGLRPQRRAAGGRGRPAAAAAGARRSPGSLIDVALLLWRGSRRPDGAVAGCGPPRCSRRGSSPRRRSAVAVPGARRARRDPAQQRRRGRDRPASRTCSRAAALLALLVAARRARLGRDARTLALVARGLLLATSLRGWGITGHDIQAEFFAFRLTNDAPELVDGRAPERLQRLPERQHPADRPRAGHRAVRRVRLQGAAAAGVRAGAGADLPLARRFVPRRLALAAAVLTMAFPTFFTDMPYLVRQEIAFFFLACMLARGDRAAAASRPHGRAARGFFGVGVVLSHYSTTYLLLMGLVARVVVLLVWGCSPWSGAGPRRSRNRECAGAAQPAAGRVPRGRQLVWAGPVTDTGGHAEDVAKETIAAIFGEGEDRARRPRTCPTACSRRTTRQPARAAGHVRRRDHGRPQAGASRASSWSEKPGAAELRPKILDRDRAPAHRRRARPSTRSASTPSTVNAGLRIGARRARPAAARRRSRAAGACAARVCSCVEDVDASDDDHDDRRTGGAQRVHARAGCVVLGAVGVLGLVVLVPSLSVEYGVLRAFQQTLLVVAPVMATGMWLLLKRVPGTRAAALVVAVPVGLLLILPVSLPDAPRRQPAAAGAGELRARTTTATWPPTPTCSR